MPCAIKTYSLGFLGGQNRGWWPLHEAITRNHRWKTMDDLLDLTFDWFESRTHFHVTTQHVRENGKNEVTPRSCGSHLETTREMR